MRIRRRGRIRQERPPGRDVFGLGGNCRDESVHRSPSPPAARITRRVKSADLFRELNGLDGSSTGCAARTMSSSIRRSPDMSACRTRARIWAEVSPSGRMSRKTSATTRGRSWWAVPFRAVKPHVTCTSRPACALPDCPTAIHSKRTAGWCHTPAASLSACEPRRRAFMASAPAQHNPRRCGPRAGMVPRLRSQRRPAGAEAGVAGDIGVGLGAWIH